MADFAEKPFDASTNLKLAVEYDALNQTASAVSFYLRAAEYGHNTDPLIVYASLLRMSLCFERQKDRAATVSSAILHAIAYLPERPEAYFLMSRFYERTSTWQESYTFAEMGLRFTNQRLPLPVDVEYLGKYCLDFQKAVSSYWIGRKSESIKLFLDLDRDSGLDPIYANSVKDNLKRVGFSQ